MSKLHSHSTGIKMCQKIKAVGKIIELDDPTGHAMYIDDKTIKYNG